MDLIFGSIGKILENKDMVQSIIIYFMQPPSFQL